jgi:hypothetical protein
MITRKHILAGLLAATAAGVSAPAHAQVSGAIGTADPLAVVARTKAYQAARQQINAIDTDKNGELSNEELQRAQAAKNPALERIAAAERKANEDLQRLRAPVSRAELFVVQAVLRQYDAAQLKVVNARKIGVLLRANAFLYAPDAVDVSEAIAAEIDKVAPSVPTAPPQDWNPDQTTFQMWQGLKEAEAQAIAYQQAVQQQQAAQRPAQGGAAPAAGAPAARPAPAQPARPADPR